MDFNFYGLEEKQISIESNKIRRGEIKNRSIIITLGSIILIMIILLIIMSYIYYQI